MAEAVAGLAVAGSVIAVIQIADRVIGLCKFYLGSVHDAPSDLRTIFFEISAIKVILEYVELISGHSLPDKLERL